MRNAIIIVVIIGMIGWAIYGFIDKQSNTALIDSNDAETTEVNDAEQVEVADGEGEVKKEKMSTAGAPQQMGFEPGEEAPDFELETMDGEPAKLSDYRGQKVLLNFWATWCPPCRDEIPDMQAFHEDYGDDVAVLAVNLTSEEASVNNVASFLEEFGAEFTVLKDVDTSVAIAYGAMALPTTYIIDRDGMIYNKAIGPLTYGDMVEVFGHIE
ncbi:MAG TPA: TlpA disulfide reductase family protein [Pseudogracilibacillus sp.]|nr:TlpA disulfide reductase family protein [Pseudogracilibacillus sp.]